MAAQLAKSDESMIDCKTAEDLLPVLPASTSFEGDDLVVGGVNMVKLAREAGTAVYIMDEEHIRQNLRDYIHWTRYHWKDVDIAYAGKAFLCVEMARIVAEENCSLDVSSGGELAVARRANFPMDRIYVHGNNKTEQELIECLEARVGVIVIDSFDEIERLSRLAANRDQTQDVLIRVTPGIQADTHDFIKTGAEDSKFGFGLNQGLAMEAIKRAIAAPGINFKGIHMHIGSQIFALNSFAEAIAVAVDFMSQIKEETGCEVELFDTGGGLGVAYGVPDEPSTIQEYGKVIVDGIKEECEKHNLRVPKMAVEPGRSIVANPGITLYTVGTVKEIPGVRTYVAIDGGMTDNIRTALYGAHYEAFVANKSLQPRNMLGTVAGKHCESGDIVVSDGPLQDPEVGDIICVAATGAYCHSLASNYNKQVRPGVIFVKDGKWRWVVRRESYEDLMRNDVY